MLSGLVFISVIYPENHQSVPKLLHRTISPNKSLVVKLKMMLTLLVYLAMSAATSAEAVGIYRSVATGEDEAAVPKLDAATMATEAGLLDTRVTADVDVLSGVSFC